MSVKQERSIRIDSLQRNGLKILQDPQRFCFGMDAVLLTEFVTIYPHEIVLDIGSGTGVIPILLTAKSEGGQFYGLEIQQASVALAHQSILLNHLEERVFIYEGDIKKEPNFFKPAQFDVITVNPPYIPNGGGLINPLAPKAISRHEILCTLKDVVSTAAILLKPGGRLYMVHRPQRLADILNCFREHTIEPKKMRLVQSYIRKKPNMVLLEGIRGGKPMLDVLPNLIIHQENGCYTSEVQKIYQNEEL